MDSWLCDNGKEEEEEEEEEETRNFKRESRYTLPAVDPYGVCTVSLPNITVAMKKVFFVMRCYSIV
jgi:hypothetical protein